MDKIKLIEKLDEKIEDSMSLILNPVVVCEKLMPYMDILPIWSEDSRKLRMNKIKSYMENGACEHMVCLEDILCSYIEHLDILIGEVLARRSFDSYRILYYTFTQIPAKIEYYIERNLEKQSN